MMVYDDLVLLNQMVAWNHLRRQRWSSRRIYSGTSKLCFKERKRLGICPCIWMWGDDFFPSSGGALVFIHQRMATASSTRNFVGWHSLWDIVECFQHMCDYLYSSYHILCCLPYAAMCSICSGSMGNLRFQGDPR